MAIQDTKPTCSICTYWHMSGFNKGRQGWCSHVKHSAEHFGTKAAKAGIQPDCPLIKNNCWVIEIEL